MRLISSSILIFSQNKLICGFQTCPHYSLFLTGNGSDFLSFYLDNMKYVENTFSSKPFDKTMVTAEARPPARSEPIPPRREDAEFNDRFCSHSMALELRNHLSIYAQYWK